MKIAFTHYIGVADFTEISSFLPGTIYMNFSI